MLLCSTPFGITAYVTSSSRSANTRSRITCAQRLSASLTYVTHQLSVNRDGAVLVLNAFRHHCLRHPQLGEESVTDRCAQRLSASLTYVTSPSCRTCVNQWSCSTPFGITAYVTPPLISLFTLLIRCSTPFGITAYVTVLPFESPAIRRLRAQRLSASLLTSPSFPGSCSQSTYITSFQGSPLPPSFPVFPPSGPETALAATPFPTVTCDRIHASSELSKSRNLRPAQVMDRISPAFAKTASHP